MVVYDKNIKEGVLKPEILAFRFFDRVCEETE